MVNLFQHLQNKIPKQVRDDANLQFILKNRQFGKEQFQKPIIQLKFESSKCINN